MQNNVIRLIVLASPDVCFGRNVVTIIVVATTGCIKVLMDWGMDPNIYRNGQVTPLMDACANDHLE